MFPFLLRWQCEEQEEGRGRGSGKKERELLETKGSLVLSEILKPVFENFGERWLANFAFFPLTFWKSLVEAQRIVSSTFT